MRVAWDARVLVNGDLRGMGTYAYHLLGALGRCRKDLDLRLFHDEGTREMPLNGFRASRIGPNRGYRWQLWERLGLPLHAYVSGCDLLHSPANTTPPHCPIPRIVTLHDAMPFLDWNTDADRLPYFQDTQRQAVLGADAVITDSLYSKQDICKTLRVPESRVFVIPIAGSPEVTRPGADAVVRTMRALDVAAPFVLGLGATAKRKNTIGILRAFAELLERSRDVSLVLTGVGPNLRRTIDAEMGRLSLPASRVRLLGFVEAQELAALYAGCSAFLFLSLYEGFGIPILDAMQCGAPVVCSNRASCPEVAGDAALLVDPENPGEVAEAAFEILNRSNAVRDEWRRRGESRAAAFSWELTAEHTAKLYDAVV
jgi:glycosyltransferase involved in cell wall biosynthesis